MTQALAWIGWALIIAAVLAWLSIFAVPFVPFLEGRRLMWALGLWIGGEILFTIGALLAAPMLLKNRGEILRKFFGKKPPPA
jgi:hypothetical protein